MRYSIKRFSHLFLFVAFVSTALAQDLPKVSAAFFPNPKITDSNVAIAGTKKGYTSYRGMVRFLKEIRDKNPSLISLETIGKTQKGKDIYGVKIACETGASDKMRVVYMARVHGDEPGGTEGLLYFLDRITKDACLQSVLDKIDIYLLPMVNVDGGEKMIRQTANGIDLNRDQVRMESPEAVAMRSYVNRIDPHVCVDFHEYQPLKSAYALISPEVLTVPWDVMFLTSGNPNVASPVRSAIDSLFVPQAQSLLAANRFTTHTYYTPKRNSQGVVLNMGGSSPRSTSNTFALSNMYSILIEGRGIGLGRKGIARRMEQIYLLATAFARTSSENKEALLAGLKKAPEERNAVAIGFASEKKADYPIPFINQLKCRIDTVAMNVSDAMASRVTASRPLPDTYYLLPSEREALETLHKMGIETTILEHPVVANVEAYEVTDAQEEGHSFRTFTPLKVTTRLTEKVVTLPAGTIALDTRQPKVRLLSVMLEPESSNGFVNYRIIGAEKGMELPVYRSVNK